MNNKIKIALIIVAIILILNGLINIFDNGEILAYDLTSMLCGIGFLLIGILVKKSNI